MGSLKVLHGWGSQIPPQQGTHPHPLPEFAQVWGFSTVLLCCGVTTIGGSHPSVRGGVGMNEIFSTSPPQSPCGVCSSLKSFALSHDQEQPHREKLCKGKEG